MTRQTRHSAFTLLELVLVLVVIAIVVSAIAPSLTNWRRGSSLRDAGDQFLAVARWARAQSIGDGRVHRLNVDSTAGRYWVTAQDGQEFVSTQTEFGRIFNMPEGFRIAMITEQGEPLDSVDFYPSGRARAAHVRITSSTSEIIDIICPSPAEVFQLASAAAEGSR